MTQFSLLHLLMLALHAGWGPAGPDWDAGGRRYPPFDDGGRYRHPYDSRGGFERPGSPPIPRRGPPNGGPGGWNRPVSPGFPPDYDRPAGGGRAWGAGAGWDGPLDRRRGPSTDRDAGWGVSAAAPPRGPASSAAAVPLEALSPEREEPRLPSPPKQALPAAPPTALPAPPSRRSQREVSPTATPSEATIIRDNGRSNGLREAAAHTPSGQQQRPNGQHRSSELPGSSGVAEAAAAADAAKPQAVSDSRAAADSDQVKAPVSAVTSEAPTARVWYYVDPQVNFTGCSSTMSALQQGKISACRSARGCNTSALSVPQGMTQGPCSIAQFQKWLHGMASKPHLKVEYEQFKSVAVWKVRSQPLLPCARPSHARSSSPLPCC